jgi:uncharacterized Fe-S cluster protein YjdI
MTKRLQIYEAPGITVTYDPNLCVHAAECVRGLPAVFDPAGRPWIRPELATPDEVERAVDRCPTGALHSVRPGAVAAPPADSAAAALPRARPVTVKLLAHGPLLVSGAIRIETEAGEFVMEGTKVALCRCGGTGNPPFCDGSHARRNFRPAR